MASPARILPAAAKTAPIPQRDAPVWTGWSGEPYAACLCDLTLANALAGDNAVLIAVKRGTSSLNTGIAKTLDVCPAHHTAANAEYWVSSMRRAGGTELHVVLTDSPSERDAAVIDLHPSKGPA